jgi:hypothetical protein
MLVWSRTERKAKGPPIPNKPQVNSRLGSKKLWECQQAHQVQYQTLTLRR